MKYLKMDITDVNKGIVAHGVNCQGVMGLGIAKAISNKWPLVKAVFLQEFQNKTRLQLGMYSIIEIGNTNKLFIANLYTQQYYGSDGTIYASVCAIKTALEALYAIKRINHLSIYIPHIGCGLGGLSWSKNVEPIINKIDIDNRIIVVEL